MFLKKHRSVAFRLLTAATISNAFIFTGCGPNGISGKQESKNEEGESILRVWMELKGSLFGAKFPDGGLELYAIGDGDASKRNKIASFAGTVYGANTATFEAAAVIGFELPAGSTTWKLELDSLLGMTCSFDPSSGNLSDLPTKEPDNPPQGASLTAADSRFAVNTSCEAARVVAGSAKGHHGDVKLLVNDSETITVAANGGEATGFSIDTSAVAPTETSSGPDAGLNGRASAYWSLWGVTSSGMIKTSYKVAIDEVPAGQNCRFESKDEANGDTDTVKTVLLSVEVVDLKLTAGSNVVQQPAYKEYLAPNLNIVCEDASVGPETFAVGGTVSGLSGTVELALNSDAETLSVNKNGEFAFATKLKAGDAYAVTVKTQPANATCTVANGAGTVADANIANITVNCASQFTLGGTVTGLTGTLKLRDFDAPTALKFVTVTADGVFVFPGTRGVGYDYQIDVIVQPDGQTCTLTNDTGILTANVTNITVTCVASAPSTFKVGGSVSNIPMAESVTLLLTYGLSNTTESLQVDWDFMQDPKLFDFLAGLNTGDAYSVTVMTQPMSATCSVDSGGSGTMGSANVTNVSISCM